MRPEIRAERDRHLLELDSSTAIRRIGGLGAEDVLEAHYSLVDYFLDRPEVPQGLHGPRQLGLLLQTVERQSAGFGKQLKWTEPMEIAATLFYGIIKNHVFHDVNKRTALLSLLIHLKQMRRLPTVDQDSLMNLALEVANDKIMEKAAEKGYGRDPDGVVKYVAWYLKRNTRRLTDVNRSPITFRELQTILGKHGYCFDNKHKNSVDICRVEEVKGFLGITRRVKKRVMNIGYPGPGAEVSPSELRRIREELKLSTRDGYDFDSFTDASDSVYRLIAEYEKPLRELADR